jgi:zinc transport system substrate-binding protein
VRSPRRRRLSTLTPLALAPLVMATLAACGDDGDDAGAGGISVVAAFYPLEEAVRGVGSDLVTVTGLTQPGQGPHDLQLQPRQLEVFADADLVVLLGRGFQPQVEDAVTNVREDATVLDLLDTVPLLSVDPQLDGTQGEVDGEVLSGDVDPHVWLDPGRMITMVLAIADTLASIDPENADTYAANADAYLEDLRGLDGEYRSALAECDSRVIVTSHRAFGYLADQYALRQIPIAGVTPGAEPDPRTLEAVAAEAEAEGVTTIFLEELAPRDLARTVAREIGAGLSLLDPIEGLTADRLDAGDDYASIMRENLERLVAGLGCTG